MDADLAAPTALSNEESVLRDRAPVSKAPDLVCFNDLPWLAPNLCQSMSAARVLDAVAGAHALTGCLAAKDPPKDGFAAL